MMGDVEIYSPCQIIGLNKCGEAEKEQEKEGGVHEREKGKVHWPMQVNLGWGIELCLAGFPSNCLSERLSKVVSPPSSYHRPPCPISSQTVKEISHSSQTVSCFITPCSYYSPEP